MVPSEEGECCSEGPRVLQTTWMGRCGGVKMCEFRNGAWKEQEVAGGGGEMKEPRDTWAWPTDKQEWPGFNVKLFVLL